MTTLLSERRPAGRIATAPVPDPAVEAAEARQYWSRTGAQPHEHAGLPPHVLALQELCLGAEARRILEFGCYSGRNLRAIGEAYATAGEAAPELVGLDINAVAVAAGAAAGLDLRLGDESALAAFADGAWDVAFTVSVLDHMPDPAAALEQLARIVRRRLILVEPHPLGDATGRAVRAAEEEDARDEPMPFTYLHDYDALLLGLGLVQELDLPMPTHLHRVGPLYRLRVLAPAPATGLRRLVAGAGPLRLHGLPPRAAARLDGRPATDAAGPALHVAADLAGLQAALAAAAPADTVVVPRRTAGRLAGALPGDRAARPIDGYLLALGPGGTPGCAADAGLLEPLLLRILLQNREDADRARVLEARLRRLEQAAAGETATPAAASAGPGAAGSVTRELVAARQGWMMGEIGALLEEEAQRTIQWRLLLNARVVAGKVGHAQRESLLEALVQALGRDMRRTEEEQRLRIGRTVARQVADARQQSLVEQVVLLHRLKGRRLWSGLPGWRSLRRSLARTLRSFRAGLAARRRPAAPPGR